MHIDDIKDKSKLDDIDDKIMLESLNTNIQLKANLLKPTALFITVANTNNNMSCMEIDTGVTQVVGGFKDGCVRAWCLDPSQTSSNSSILSALKTNPGLYIEVYIIHI